MVGRIVEVQSQGVHLSVDRGFMKVTKDGEHLGQIALDDIDALVVHSHGATFSVNLISRLSKRGAPVVMCESNHAPVGLVWPIDGHYEQGKRMEAQASASQPMRKRLWRDIVVAKIKAQADALDLVGEQGEGLRILARKTRSGDPENIEAQGARRYWPVMMGEGFTRDRTQGGVNALLNYGYTVLRAATARSIIAAGLHPSLAIHHQSRGTALRLSDDLMEPFRPFVDLTVRRLVESGEKDINRDTKAALAAIVTFDLEGPKGASPLQICLDRLSVSLAQVYLGERQDLEFPGPPLPLATTAS